MSRARAGCSSSTAALRCAARWSAATSARQRRNNGWAGVVVDGAVRDAAELAAAEVGIRALALVPLPTEKKGAGERDVAVRVQGVWIRPGDMLYADADGTVVVPRAGRRCGPQR